MKGQLSLLSSLRRLAPAGVFASPNEVFNARRELKQLNVKLSGGSPLHPSYALEHIVNRELRCNSVIFGSGKECLLRLFQVLKEQSGRDIILLSAYTCPDIAIAAILAGLKIYPLDVCLKSLDILQTEIPEHILKRTCGIVLSNLYGLADDIEGWKLVADKHKFVIIDDASQAGLGSLGGDNPVADGLDLESLGLRTSTIGVISFSRGKAFSGIGVGCVLFPEKGSKILSITPSAIRKFQRNVPVANSIRGYVLGVLGFVFENPLLYKLAESFPFLELGKTQEEIEIDCLRPSEAELSYALAKFNARAELKRVRVANMKYFQEKFLNFEAKFVQPILERGQSQLGQLESGVVLIRYPLVFHSGEMRDEIFNKLKFLGLGVSKSYPRELTGFKNIEPHCMSSSVENAREVSRRILTLPLHENVRKTDIDRILEVIDKA